jgi:primosomal protein N' (replication factor Y)
MIRVEVAVAAPLDQSLTYDLDEGLLLAATGNGDPVGLRVMVPLGRRSVTGYVLAVCEPAELAYTVRRIGRILDRMPLFPAGMLPFFRWAASYYHYPLGLVIKAALPAGLAPKSVREIVLVAGKEQLLHDHFASAPSPPAWAMRLLDGGHLPAKESKTILARKSARQNVDTLIEQGVLELHETVLQDTVREKRETCFELSPELREHLGFTGSEGKNPSPDLGLLPSGLVKSDRRTLTEMLSMMAKDGISDIPARELFKRHAGARKAVVSLIEQGLIGRREYRIYRSPFGEPLPVQARPPLLTPGQRKVLAQIEPALAARAYRTFLLHGVTGCGKTEVYLRAAEKTLTLGRDVLVLVPEIALATQIEAQFLSRFGDAVVLLHSGLSGAERFDQWHLALSGRAKVVIGARSALFAPLADPGLIVVDEEHDGGFKQDDSFRYHGRDLAVLRGRFHDAVVLLGSATPSVTSYHHAVTGKYTLLKMAERVGERALPSVTVVDLSRKRQGGEKGLFRQELRQALVDNLGKGQQSLLLLNRRGFSPVMLCQDCGSPVECLHCRVSLTLHKAKGCLVCHYCGYTVDHRVVCSRCHSTGSMVPVGFGTERVEDEVKLLLPEARIARLDSDSAADRKVFLKILRAMHEREIDILVGTQMIAKGHHFPHVTLVGVVWADGGLNMPDFRAAEKTFQLITQVTGRAGRGDEPGRVIIQTMRPDHYSIRLARQHQYEELYRHELQLRRSPVFPPFVRLVALHIQGEDEGDVRQSAQRLAGCCREEKKKRGLAVEILGPAPSPIERMNRNYRWQILLKAADLEELHLLCRQVQESRGELVSSGCRMSIDVDPENMM